MRITVVETGDQFLAFGGSPRHRATAATLNDAVVAVALAAEVIVIDRPDQDDAGEAPTKAEAPADPTSGLSFDQAVNAMRQGKRVAREGLEAFGWLEQDPRFHPHWALHIPTAKADPETGSLASSERVVQWPQIGPRGDPGVRAMMAANDWKVLA